MTMSRTALSSNILPPTNVDNKLAILLYAQSGQDIRVLMERADFADLDSTDRWKLPQADLMGGHWAAAQARGLLLMRYGLETDEVALINVSHVPFRDKLPDAHAARKGFGFTDTYVVVLEILGPLHHVGAENMSKWVPRAEVPDVCQGFKRETIIHALNGMPGHPVLE